VLDLALQELDVRKTGRLPVLLGEASISSVMSRP